MIEALLIAAEAAGYLMLVFGFFWFLFLIGQSDTGAGVIYFATGPIAHPAKGEPYHLVNSLRGIRRAKRRGYRRIDLDLSITADGVIVVNHWPRLLRRDGYSDPAGKVGRNAVISKLLWRQVARLRTVIGKYRVITLRRALEECARLHLEAVIEPKDDLRFRQAHTWSEIDAIRWETKSDVQVRVLAKNNPRGVVVDLASMYFKAWEI